MQFLETKNGLPLVKFWLDCEALKTLSSDGQTAQATIRTENCRDDDCVSSTTSCSDNNNLDEQETATSDEVDNVKITNTKIIDSMTQSLTDDEKSKIFCEKNQKRVKKSHPTMQEDALGIYRKYLVTDSIDSIELPATILSKLSLALCDTKSDYDSDDDNSTLWQAFDDAQKHVMDVMEKDFLTQFLESSFYYKYTVDVLTSETLNLNEILRNETALFFFMEFLEQEDKSNCKLPYLEFWLSASNFHKQNDQSLQQIKSDALVIYEKWFSLQATSSLKISDRVRTKVEEMICSVDPDMIQRSFDIPTKIVEVYLENSCFKKFVKSQLFYKHLADVMAKAEGHEKPTVVTSNNGILKRSISISSSISSLNQHRRTRSDAHKTISAQNTLLAGLDHRKSAKNTADLHIDARQLDPDMLWRRKSSNGILSFGRVDEMGRYERDFELPTEKSTQNSMPHSKSAFQLKSQSIDVDDPHSIVELNAQNKFRNVMRKLTGHLQDDDMQQEIAWQVAEMIVKDVTSITLSTGDNEI